MDAREKLRHALRGLSGNGCHCGITGDPDHDALHTFMDKVMDEECHGLVERLEKQMTAKDLPNILKDAPGYATMGLAVGCVAGRMLVSTFMSIALNAGPEHAIEWLGSQLNDVVMNLKLQSGLCIEGGYRLHGRWCRNVGAQIVEGKEPAKCERCGGTHG